MGAYEYRALPGDLNGDEVVNSADLDIVRANWGSTVTAGSLLDGDPSGDGIVSGDDLDLVRANWGPAVPAAAIDAVLAESDSSAPGKAALSPRNRTFYGPLNQAASEAASESGNAPSARRNVAALALQAWICELKSLDRGDY